MKKNNMDYINWRKTQQSINIYIYIYIYAHIESILKHQQKDKGHRKKQQKNDIKIQNNHIRRKCK